MAIYEKSHTFAVYKIVYSILFSLERERETAQFHEIDQFLSYFIVFSTHIYFHYGHQISVNYSN